MKIQDSGKQLNNAVISEFEKQLNIKLPQDYKDFILKNNGGTPEKDWAFDFVDIVTKSKTNSTILSFFVIYEEETYEDDDLRQTYFMLQEGGGLKSGILPIADDPGGNFICMSVSAENYGRIFFCDHEVEDPVTGYMIMSVIADSFSEFIDMLYEFVIEEE